MEWRTDIDGPAGEVLTIWRSPKDEHFLMVLQRNGSRNSFPFKSLVLAKADALSSFGVSVDSWRLVSR